MSFPQSIQLRRTWCAYGGTWRAHIRRCSQGSGAIPSRGLARYLRKCRQISPKVRRKPPEVWRDTCGSVARYRQRSGESPRRLAPIPGECAGSTGAHMRRSPDISPRVSRQGSTAALRCPFQACFHPPKARFRKEDGGNRVETFTGFRLAPRQGKQGEGRCLLIEPPWKILDCLVQNSPEIYSVCVRVLYWRGLVGFRVNYRQSRER